jgi:hypothetical protein
MDNKKVNIFKLLLYIIYIASIVYFLFTGEKGKAFISFISLFITFILSKLYFKNFTVIDKPLYIFGNLFILASLVIGSCYRMYDFFKPYDSFLHFWSGFITVKICWNILRYIMVITSSSIVNKLLFFTVIFFFAMGVSGVCELAEYLLDVFFKMDTQSGGLKDTMQDMLYALSAAILMIIYYFRKYNKFIKRL